MSECRNQPQVDPLAPWSLWFIEKQSDPVENTQLICISDLFFSPPSSTQSRHDALLEGRAGEEPSRKPLERRGECATPPPPGPGGQGGWQLQA